MVRLASAALILLSLPATAWSNPPEAKAAGHKPSFQMPRPSSDYGLASETRIGRAEIAPNAHFGFGMFGLKSEKSPLRPVTVREINAPKQRRAAVGFSLKF